MHTSADTDTTTANTDLIAPHITAPQSHDRRPSFNRHLAFQSAFQTAPTCCATLYDDDNAAQLTCG